MLEEVQIKYPNNAVFTSCGAVLCYLKMKCSSDSRRKEHRMIALESSFEHTDEMWSYQPLVVITNKCWCLKLENYPSNSIDGLVYKMEVVIVFNKIAYK